MDSHLLFGKNDGFFLLLRDVLDEKFLPRRSLSKKLFLEFKFGVKPFLKVHFANDPKTPKFIASASLASNFKILKVSMHKKIVLLILGSPWKEKECTHVL